MTFPTDHLWFLVPAACVVLLHLDTFAGDAWRVACWIGGVLDRVMRAGATWR